MSSSSSNPTPYYSESPSSYESFEPYPESELTNATQDVSMEDSAAGQQTAEDSQDPNSGYQGYDYADQESLASEEGEEDANKPPYPMHSIMGKILLERIRKHLSLHPEATAEQIQTHLANSPSILRHLRSASVAHPGHYVTDTHGDLYEPRVGRAAGRQNAFRLMDIQKIVWTDRLLRDALFIVSDRDQNAQVFVREEMRKMYIGDLPRQVLLRRREEDPEYARMMEESRMEVLLLRELRPNSLLREVVSAVDTDDEEKSGSSDAEPSSSSSAGQSSSSNSSEAEQSGHSDF